MAKQTTYKILLAGFSICIVMMLMFHLVDNAFRSGWEAGKEWKLKEVNAVLKCYNCNWSDFDPVCGAKFLEDYGYMESLEDVE